MAGEGHGPEPRSGGAAALIKAWALTYALVNVALLVLAVIDRSALGLPLPRLMVLGLLPLAFHVGVALLPWDGLVGTRRGTTLLTVYVVVNLLAAAGGYLGAREPHVHLLWLPLLSLVLSALALPPRIHAAVSTVTVLMIPALLALRDHDLASFALGVLLVVYVVVAAFTGYSAFVTRTAMTEAMELHAEADRSADVLASVAHAGRSLASLDNEQVLRVVVDTTEALGYEMVGLYVEDEDPDYLRYASSAGLPENLRGERTPRTAGIAGQILAAGETLTTEDYSSLPDAIPSYVDLGLRSAIGTPIWAEGQMAGVLVAGSLRRWHFTSRDVQAIELLAGQAGRALELVRRFEKQEQLVSRLREIDELKQDFLANVSHEMRTPLTVIAGLSETMDVRWGEISEDAHRHLLSRVRDNADALDQVVSDLLDFSRLERGRLRTSFQRFDLSDLARSTVDRLQPLLEEQDVTVAIEDGLVIDGDQRLLERVIENFVSNAGRHTPPGTAVEVVLRHIDEHARFSVTDDGPGINPDDLPHLGERFYRGGNSRTQATRGLGLGLAFSFEILRLHDSTIEIESTPGEGATFWFALPLAVSRPAEPDVSQASRRS